MTISVSSEVPRWMVENRRSREQFLSEYGVATVNPDARQKPAEGKAPKAQTKSSFKKRSTRRK